jgi:hypothetical protein
MKAIFPLVVLAALVAGAQAQTAQQDKTTEPKGIDAKSPWSVKSFDQNDGLLGSSSTTVTRDLGDGWSVGGKMTTPYQDERIGGSGAPGLKQYEKPGANTTFGPVFEKKF